MIDEKTVIVNRGQVRVNNLTATRCTVITESTNSD